MISCKDKGPPFVGSGIGVTGLGLRVGFRVKGEVGLKVLRFAIAGVKVRVRVRVRVRSTSVYPQT